MSNILFDVFRIPTILLHDYSDYTFPGLFPENYIDELIHLKDPQAIVIFSAAIKIMCCKRHIWNLNADNINIGFSRAELATKLCERYILLHPQCPTVERRVYYISELVTSPKHVELYYIKVSCAI